MGFARLFALVALLSLGSQAAVADTRKIAYITNLKLEAVEPNIAKLKALVEAQQKEAGVKVDHLEFKTFPFRLIYSTDSDSARKEKESFNSRSIAEMLGWAPDLIYSPGSHAAKAAAVAAVAKAAAEKREPVQVLFGCKCNPTGEGHQLIEKGKQNAPGGNLGGFTRYFIDESDPGHPTNLFEKRLELLKRAMPNTDKPRVVAFYNEEFDAKKWKYEERAAADPINVKLVLRRVTRESLGRLQQILDEERADGGIVFADTFMDDNQKAMAAAAAGIPKPIIFPWNEAAHGAWLHLGTVVDLEKMASDYMVKVFSGKKIGELRVRAPDRVEFGINHETWKRHGRQIPASYEYEPFYRRYPRER